MRSLGKLAAGFGGSVRFVEPPNLQLVPGTRWYRVLKTSLCNCVAQLHKLLSEGDGARTRNHRIDSYKGLIPYLGGA